MTKVFLILTAGAVCITAGAAFSMPLLMATPCIAIMLATVLKG